MASHKIAAMLRSTGQLSDQEIGNMSEEDAWEWLRSNTTIPDGAGNDTCSADDS